MNITGNKNHLFQISTFSMTLACLEKQNTVNKNEAPHDKNADRIPAF